MKLQIGKPVEKRVVSPEERHALADTIGPEWRAMIYLAGVMALRFGEVAALQVADVDFDRQRLHVVKAVSESGGHLEVG